MVISRLWSDQVSDPQIDDELLHRYADGDLSAPEAQNVESTLASDPVAKGRYQAILQLHTVLEASGLEMAAGADPDRMFAAIETGIARTAAEESAAKVPAQSADAQGFWSRLFDARAWVPATGALVAVGAVLLTVYSPVRPDELVPPPTPVDSAQTTAAEPSDVQAAEPAAPTAVDPTAAPPVAAPTGAAARSEIVEVDFGQNAGTVFEIALENGSSTPVVWINA